MHSGEPAPVKLHFNSKDLLVNALLSLLSPRWQFSLSKDAEMSARASESGGREVVQREKGRGGKEGGEEEEGNRKLERNIEIKEERGGSDKTRPRGR